MIKAYARLGIALFILLSLCISLYEFYRVLHRPMSIHAGQSTIISLDKHTSAVSFSRALYARHWIQSPRLLVLWIRWHGWSNRLKAGVYQVKPGETAKQLLLRVVDGDVLVLPFRIGEGVTQADVSTQLQKAPYLTYQTSDWTNITEDHVSAEGLLLADTYHYDAGSSGAALLMQAHHNLVRFLAECWEKRTASLPYKSPYELLIAASIIEKEASKSEERRIISGVIVNRLRKRMPLQMDPTVIYALGPLFQKSLTHQQLLVESPYNTYQHYGLPPTPIAMVGKEAIEAAAHPELSKYFYFVARGDGSHQFSETYEQQKRAVIEYRR